MDALMLWQMNFLCKNITDDNLINAARVWFWIDKKKKIKKQIKKNFVQRKNTKADLKWKKYTNSNLSWNFQVNCHTIGTQLFSSKYCKIYKNTYFEKHLQMAASSWRVWVIKELMQNNFTFHEANIFS